VRPLEEDRPGSEEGFDEIRDIAEATPDQIGHAGLAAEVGIGAFE
jgi:hypothetical protein